MCELVTFAELKERLELSKYPLLTDYPDLESIKTSVEEAIKSYLSRELCYGTYVERVSTSFVSGNLVPLYGLPINSLTSISAVTGSYPSSVDASVYEDTDNFSKSYAWLSANFELSDIQLDVTYIGGLSEIPDALHRAALLQTMHEWQTKTYVGVTDISSGNASGSVVRPPLELLTEVKRLLIDYVHPARDSLLGQREIISFVEIP